MPLIQLHSLVALRTTGSYCLICYLEFKAKGNKERLTPAVDFRED